MTNSNEIDFWELCLDSYYVMFWVDDSNCVTGRYYVGDEH